jgi:thymidine kinase
MPIKVIIEVGLKSFVIQYSMSYPDATEYVTKVHAICMNCGELAQYSHRLVADSEQVMLGETDSYEPLCRRCYMEKMSGR